MRPAVAFDLDDIQVWAGQGTNRAALVIDWVDDGKAPEQLAWGYCWSGSATGKTMLDALVAAEPRLMCQPYLAFPNTVFGLGYDLDADGGGHTGPDMRYETGAPLDADDHYREGWKVSHYWSYFVSPSAPSGGGVPWVHSAVGYTARTLSDGGWDGWRFSLLGDETTPPGPVSAAVGSGTRTLTVIGGAAGADPGPGSHVLPFGALQRASGTHSAGGTNVSATGWSATGALQGSGAGATTPWFGLTADTVVTWQTTTQYWCDLSVDGPGTIDVTSGWYTAGSELILFPAPDDPGTGRFFGWRGDTTLSNHWAVPLTVTMDQARAVTAVFRSPFATEVVDFEYLDTIYDDPTTALGRPSLMTPADDASGDEWPVVPVFAPWGEDQVVGIWGPLFEGDLAGFLTLKFDHPLEDDPANPYGTDLIVFGNTFQELGGENNWANGNPSNAIINTQLLNPEPATVAVSQDGVTWFSFDAGPYADGWIPTLGRQLQPDPAAIGDDRYWGDPTDPTLPHDPSITAADYVGMSVAEMASFFGASAGGTGFDLADLSGLPASSPNGRKWCRYVRITADHLFSDPEIDAVADVMPLPPLELWKREHYSWWSLGTPEVVGETASASNGLPNLLNYAMAWEPDTAPGGSEYLGTEVVTVEGQPWFAVTYRRNAAATDVDVRLERAPALPALPGAWNSAGIRQDWAVLSLGGGVEQVTGLVPAGATQQVVRLKVESRNP